MLCHSILGFVQWVGYEKKTFNAASCRRLSIKNVSGVVKLLRRALTVFLVSAFQLKKTALKMPQEADKLKLLQCGGP